MRLRLGSRTLDLATRALVLQVMGTTGAGADIVELGESSRDWAGRVPVCARPKDDAAVADCIARGAHVIRLHGWASATTYARCAMAGTVVVVGPGGVAPARTAGVAAERIVVEVTVGDEAHVEGDQPVMIDVAEDACPNAATAVGIIAGARVVRTRDVRGGRRISDVLAAIMEAR